MTLGAAAVRDQVLRVLDGERPAPIVQAGHPVLRAAARAYEGELSTSELTALLDLMRDTMRDAPGVGLAAPQIGISLRIAVVEDPGHLDPTLAVARERLPMRYRVLVNPAYAPVGTEDVSFYEGCLSVNGWQAVVARHRRVRLTGADENGIAIDEELTGWQARIIQHETDHLDGTLYVDRAEIRSLATGDSLGALWATEPHPVAAAQVLGFDLD